MWNRRTWCWFDFRGACISLTFKITYVLALTTTKTKKQQHSQELGAHQSPLNKPRAGRAVHAVLPNHRWRHTDHSESFPISQGQGNLNI